jgi:hypothetical protein
VAAGASPAKPPSALLVFLFAPDLKALARVAKLRAQMRDDAAAWVVYPKGRKDIREADVLGAGRATGMKDVKVARFSDTQTIKQFEGTAHRARARPRARRAEASTTMHNICFAEGPKQICRSIRSDSSCRRE